MTEDIRPSLSQRGETERAARLEREASALRANLRKRKAQQRSLPEQKAPVIQSDDPVG